MHNGINGLTKVRLLNQGIKTKEPDVPKSQIMASAALRQDFDACISLYKEFIEANATITPMFNVSEAQTTYKGKPKDRKYAHKRGPKRRNDDDDPEEDVEYDTLTKGQKFSLKKKRERQGSKRSKTEVVTSRLHP
eukprot:scaffold31941_cov69-Attheya_sp.AAC.5